MDLETTDNELEKELLFIWGVLNRPADAKYLCKFFKPSWLKNAPCAKLLNDIFEFRSQNNRIPSLKELERILKDQDTNLYERRYKSYLDKIKEVKSADGKEIAYIIDRLSKRGYLLLSKELNEAAESDDSISLGETRSRASELNRIRLNTGTEFEEPQFFKEFVETADINVGKNYKVKCGIWAIDELIGGLRPPSLGIILAPTGGGKSTCLTVIAYMMSHMENKVLFISNELSRRQVAEKLTALHTRKCLSEVTGVSQKGQLRSLNLEDNEDLVVHTINSEHSADDLQDTIINLREKHGWEPDVIVIDYMGRMKPSGSGYNRDSTWNWMGGVAEDLSRLAKQYEAVIWTAGQTNRKGFNSRVQDMAEFAQGSIKHLQEASAVVGVKKRSDVLEKEILGEGDPRTITALEFSALKVREQYHSTRSIMVEVDFGSLSITKNVIQPELQDDGTAVSEKSVLFSDDQKTAREKQEERQSRKKFERSVFDKNV